MECYSALKRNDLSSHDKIWKKAKCILLREMNQYEEATYYDSNYMTFWKRQNYGDSEKISECQELEYRVMNTWDTEDF